LWSGLVLIYMTDKHSEQARGVAAIPVLVLTGPVGVGKTSVAVAISDLLNTRGVAHAVIDADWLRWCHPSPPHDPFQMQLGLRNLAAVWANYRNAGAARLVLADIVETRAILAEYRSAIPGAAITLVRLHAALPALHARLAQREAGASLSWHQQRAGELLAQMERDALEDLRVDTEGKAIGDIAAEVLGRAGWA
jgi:chloramphenicol 3-O-phosphotransferase